MKNSKPSLKGMKHVGYLGHFAKDKHIQRGHNSNGVVTVRQLAAEDSTESKPLFQLGGTAGVGPDVDKPAAGPGQEVIHNPNGGYSILDYADPDYLNKKKKLQGRS